MTAPAPSPSAEGCPLLDEAFGPYLSGVVGVVEANSYEHHMLWREYANEAAKFALSDSRTRYQWKETGHGHLARVGEIDDRPIWICLLTATVDSHKLLFWHVTSPVADYGRCEAWLAANLPPTAFDGDGRINRTDAMNFCNVFPRSALSTQTGGES